MLKRYIYNGAEFQFIEGKQPEGAVEIETAPKKKTTTPKNKARKADKK